MESPLAEAAGGTAPSVTILITVYNGDRFIGASVSAALRQDYPNFEVLVVDDGSEDRTANICRAMRNPRLRYVRLDRVGRRKALNQAIALAGGDYIAINDADDLSLPHRLRASIQCFSENPGLAFLGTAYLTTDVFLEEIPERYLCREAQSGAAADRISAARLYRSNPFINSTVMFPKRVWTAMGGYDEELTNCEDYDFFLRALQWGSAAWVKDPTVLWYTNPTSFFKRISAAEYLRTLRLIKRRAHRLLRLPRWVSLYDGLDVVAAARSLALQYRARFRAPSLQAKSR